MIAYTKADVTRIVTRWSSIRKEPEGVTVIYQRDLAILVDAYLVQRHEAAEREDYITALEGTLTAMRAETAPTRRIA